MSIQRVIKAIKRHSRFLITSHIDAEGDALGSELALASLLRKLGKGVSIINNESVPSDYSFLPGIKQICSQLPGRDFQAVFIIDCPIKDRVGKLAKYIGREKPIINIDHHLDNSNFGRINWVDPQSSSTGEMIYRLFTLAGIKLDKKDALNIYTAIVTDTGSFRHANTASSTLLVASKLVDFGLKPDEIYAKIYEANSVQEAISTAKIISSLSFCEDNKIAWVKIAQPEFNRIKRRHKILDKVLEFAKSIHTVKVVIIFAQQDMHTIKLSLRSRRPVNVQKIAKLYGGGGHKFASGCIIKASFRQAKQMALKAARKALAAN